MSATRNARRLAEKAKRKKKLKDDPRKGVKPTKCPTCHYKMDAATTTMGVRARPKAGDYSVCINCGTIMRFDEECEPVLALGEDMAELLEASPETYEHLLKASAMLKKMAASGQPLKEREIPRNRSLRQIALIEWCELAEGGEGPIVRCSNADDLGFAAFTLCQTMTKMPAFKGVAGVVEAAEALMKALSPSGARLPDIEIYEGQKDSA